MQSTGEVNQSSPEGAGSQPDNQVTSPERQTPKSLGHVTNREIAQRAYQSTVFLTTRSAEALALGSGFVVAKNTVATNHHVIEDARTIVVRTISSDSDQTYSVQKVLAADRTEDLALLRVDGLSLPPLALSDGSDLAVGDAIYVVSNPKGMTGTFSSGIISAFREWQGRRLIQVTAPVSSGSSGGPVVNQQAQVVGVVMGAIEDGQNLNFAVPVSKLRKLMRSTSTHNF